MLNLGIYPKSDRESEFTSQKLSVIVRSMITAENTLEKFVSNDSDLTELLKNIESKNRPSFEIFYDMTVSKLYSYSKRITQQHELAEEVVSDVYMQVWNKAASYQSSRGSIMAWLIIMCRSRALDALRRNSRSTSNVELSVELEQSVETIEKLSNLDTPQDLLLSTETNSSLHNALKKLDEQGRQILALAYFRGYTHNELAQFTGLPIGTVKTQIRRTVEKLKKLMADSNYSGGSDE